MTLFLWTTLAVTCAALMWALAAFDRLIEIGSATGGAGKTRGRKVEGAVIPDAKASFLRRGLARNRLFVRWLFRTPEWAAEIRIARILFHRFRIGAAVALVGFFSFGAGAFLRI